MESIIKANDGREFPRGREVLAADYERLRKRLAELTGFVEGAGDPMSPRPVALLVMDPFDLDAVNLSERILWAQELVNTWREILEWQGRERRKSPAVRRRVGDMEACLEMPMESWRWTDDARDGTWQPEDEPESEVALVREVRAQVTGAEAPELQKRLGLLRHPDPDGAAARAAGRGPGAESLPEAG